MKQEVGGRAKKQTRQKKALIFLFFITRSARIFFSFFFFVSLNSAVSRVHSRNEDCRKLTKTVLTFLSRNPSQDSSLSSHFRFCPRAVCVCVYGDYFLVSSSFVFPLIRQIVSDTHLSCIFRSVLTWFIAASPRIVVNFRVHPNSAYL